MSQQYPQAPPPGFYQPPRDRIIIIPSVGDTPQRMTCPNCHNEIVSVVSTEYSLVQHAAFFIMCITAACLLCSCIPYCMDSLSNVRHECPVCHSYLGTYKRMT
ncbi:hypothetical protein PGB90_010545 [Kerria lacca]